VPSSSFIYITSTPACLAYMPHIIPSCSSSSALAVPPPCAAASRTAAAMRRRLHRYPARCSSRWPPCCPCSSSPSPALRRSFSAAAGGGPAPAPSTRRAPGAHASEITGPSPSRWCRRRSTMLAVPMTITAARRRASARCASAPCRKGRWCGGCRIAGTCTTSSALTGGWRRTGRARCAGRSLIRARRTPMRCRRSLRRRINLTINCLFSSEKKVLDRHCNFLNYI
jgi:hypothetical protein